MRGENFLEKIQRMIDAALARKLPQVTGGLTGRMGAKWERSEENWTAQVRQTLYSKASAAFADHNNSQGFAEYYTKHKNTIGQKWAANILSYGPNVPAHVQLAAQELRMGKLSKQREGELMDVLRNYEGVYKTNSRQGKNYARMSRQVVGKLSRAGVLAQYAVSGAPGAASAVAQLVSMGSQELEKVVSSKSFKDALVRASDKIFSDPQIGLKMFRSIGRFTRSLPALGLAAEAGWTIGSPIGRLLSGEMQDIRNVAMGSSHGNALRLKANRADHAAMNRRLATDVQGQYRVGNQSLEALSKYSWALPGAAPFVEYFVQSSLEGRAAELEERKNLRVKNVQALRGMNEKYGRKMAAEISAYARKRGKTVAELSPWEVAQAKDKALGHAAEGDYGAYDPRTLSKLGVHLGQRSYWLRWASMNDEQRRAELSRIYEAEVVPEIIATENARIAARQYAGEMRRQELFNTPEKWAQFRREGQKAMTEFAAMAARHKDVEDN